MSELETGNESAATSEGNANPEPASAAQAQPAQQSQEANAAPAQKEQPFHEHPRFKELVEQKNAFARQVAEMRAQVEAIQSQKQQTQQPAKQSYDELFKELEGMNPNFSKLQQEMYQKLSRADQVEAELQDLKSWREQSQAQQAVSQFDNLCQENKVSERDKPMYKQLVANIANAKGSRVSDLPHVFKEAHDQMSKYLEDVRRTEREAYVSQKNSDKTPNTQSGGTAPASSRPAANMTSDQVKALLAAKIRGNANI